MKKTLRRLFLMLLLLLIAGGLWLVWAVKSGWVERKAFEIAIRETEKATGGRAEMKSLAIDFPGLRVRVGGFVLHGLESTDQPPLLAIDDAEADIHLLSFFGRIADLRSIKIANPRVHITASADGKTNIPVPKVRTPGRNFIDNLLAIAAKRIEVNGGYVQINDKRVPLDLVVENLKLNLSYEIAAPRYFGTFAARVSKIGIEPLLPMAFDFSTELAMERGVIRLNKAELKTKASNIQVAGLAYDLLNPSSEFGVNADISLADLGTELRVPIEHKGRVKFAGRVALQFDKRFDFEIQGLVRGQGLGIGQKSVAIGNASMRSPIDFTRARLRLTRLEVAAQGGTFNGRVELANFSELDVEGVLKDFPTNAIHVTEKPLPYSALASGPVKVSSTIGKNGFSGTRAESEVALTPVEGERPLQGVLNFVWDQRENLLEFRNAKLSTPETSIDFKGTLNSRIQASASTSNFSDLQALFAEPLPIKLDGGQATFSGFLIGSLDDLKVSGRVTMTNFVYDERKFDRLSSSIDVSHTQLEARNLTVDQGRLHLLGEAQIGLDNWKVPANPAIKASLDMRAAPIEQLLEIAEVKAPVTGVARITGDVEIHGKQMSGHARIAADHIKAWDEDLDQVLAQVRFSPDKVEVLSGRALLAGTEVPLTLDYDRKTSIAAWTISTKRLPIYSVNSIRAKFPSLHGLFSLNATGKGKLDGSAFEIKALDGEASLDALAWQDRPFGSLGASLATTQGVLNVKGEGDIRGGKMNLNGAWKLSGDYAGTATLTLAALSLEALRPLLSDRTDPLPFQSLITAQATLGMSLTKPEDWVADLAIDRFQISPNPAQQLRAAQVQDLTLANAEPIRIHITSKAAEIQSARLLATNTSLGVAGRVGLTGKEGWDLRTTGALNLAQLQILHRDLQATGSANLDATIKGNLESPQLNGSLQLRKASLYFGDLPTGLDNAEGTIIFDRNRATIQTLTAESGGGKLNLTGFVGLAGPDLVYRLQGIANQVRIRYPTDTSTQVNANLSLTGTSQDSLLAGSVTILRAGFNPRTDFGTLLNELTKGSGPAVVTPSNEYIRGMQFDVHVDSSPDLEFTTSLTRGLLADVDLRLRGNVRRPTLLGAVSVSEGEVSLFGNKYLVNRGDIRFFNPTRIEPVIDMEVETRARGITVNVNFSGTTSRLNTTYRSDPPLQPSEIIALLAVGRDPNVGAGIASSSTTTQAALQGVGSLVGEAVAASLNGRLQRFFGVSRIKIDPQLTGVDNIPQARLTLEQQMSKDITLTYITNLQRTQEQIVRIQWDFSSEWSAIAVRDENGRFGVDFQYRKRFR